MQNLYTETHEKSPYGSFDFAQRPDFLRAPGITKFHPQSSEKDCSA